MKLLRMVALNRPLYAWREFDEAGTVGYGVGYGLGDKQLDRIAQTVVAGLSHEAVVELVRREWDGLPSVVRMRVTQLANERHANPSSNNQRKGIVKLDRLLGGKILTGPAQATTSDLRVIDGRLVRRQRVVRREVAGAEIAFGAFAKPKDFDSWSPTRKRAWHQRAAAERRARREGS